MHGGTPGKPDRMPPGDDPRAGKPIPSLYSSPSVAFALRTWLAGHRLHIAVVTVLLFGGTIPVLVLAFPSVSNLTIAILSLAGSFTSALASLAELLADDDPE